MGNRLALSKCLEGYFEEISYYESLKMEFGITLSNTQKKHINKLYTTIENSPIYNLEQRICDVWLKKASSLVK